MSRARDRVGEDGSKLSARSGLPAYSGGDESSSCSRAASGRVCRRIAKLSLCPRCRWFVIPSEVDETERDEQCPIKLRHYRGAMGRDLDAIAEKDTKRYHMLRKLYETEGSRRVQH